MARTTHSAREYKSSRSAQPKRKNKAMFQSKKKRVAKTDLQMLGFLRSKHQLTEEGDLMENERLVQTLYEGRSNGLWDEKYEYDFSNPEDRSKATTNLKGRLTKLNPFRINFVGNFFAAKRAGYMELIEGFKRFYVDTTTEVLKQNQIRTDRDHKIDELCRVVEDKQNNKQNYKIWCKEDIEKNDKELAEATAKLYQLLDASGVNTANNSFAHVIEEPVIGLNDEFPPATYPIIQPSMQYQSSVYSQPSMHSQPSMQCEQSVHSQNAQMKHTQHMVQSEPMLHSQSSVESEQAWHSQNGPWVLCTDDEKEKPVHNTNNKKRDRSEAGLDNIDHDQVAKKRKIQKIEEQKAKEKRGRRQMKENLAAQKMSEFEKNITKIFEAQTNETNKKVNECINKLNEQQAVMVTQNEQIITGSARIVEALQSNQAESSSQSVEGQFDDVPSSPVSVAAVAHSVPPLPIHSDGVDDDSFMFNSL